MKSIYLIGSLRNPEIITFSNELEAQGFELFSEWHAPGPDADSYWKAYEQARGRTYAQALKGWAAKHIYEFDRFHLSRCDIAVLLAPAGRSGHLELGWALGQGKPGFILFTEEQDRWDVMLQFCTDVFFNKEDLFRCLKEL